jgi:hypothetical protein
MMGMRGSGADATPCRQHGAHGACHECVSKDTVVARYAVMFQYEFLSLGAFFCGALFLVWSAQHPVCNVLFVVRHATAALAGD